MLVPTMVVGLGSLTPSQAEIAQMVTAAANQYGVPPALALGIAQHESGFNPNATHLNQNGTTDWGVMQLNDTVVASLGVSNPLDPQQNIDAGVKLLSTYLNQYGGDPTRALEAYAAGPGAVKSGNLPAGTSSFVGYVEGYSPPSDLSVPGDFSVPAYIDGAAASDNNSGLSLSSSVMIAGFDLPVVGLITAAALSVAMLFVLLRR